MNIMGVDLSTKAVTAVTITHEAELVGWQHCEMKGKRALERLRNAYDAIDPIPWHKPSIICFERPAGKGTAAIMDIWRVQGFILGTGWIPEHTEVWEMGPSEWKKLAGLPGNASKEQIKRAFCSQVKLYEDIGDPTQDFYDAYYIALAALEFNKKGTE